MREKSIWKRKKNISKRKRPYFNFGIGNCVVKSMWEKSIWKKRPYRNGRKHFKFCFGN